MQGESEWEANRQTPRDGDKKAPLDLRAVEALRNKGGSIPPGDYLTAAEVDLLAEYAGKLLTHCRALRAALLKRNLEMQELANRAEELALFVTERDKAEVLRLVTQWREAQPAAVLTQARDE